MEIDPDALDDVGATCLRLGPCLRELAGAASIPLRASGQWSSAAAVSGILDYRVQWIAVFGDDLLDRARLAREAEAAPWLRPLELGGPADRRTGSLFDDGRSSDTRRPLARSRLAAIIHEIDAWAGSENDPVLDRLVGERDVLAGWISSTWSADAAAIPRYRTPARLSELLQLIIEHEHLFDGAHSGGDDDAISHRDLVAVAGNLLMPVPVRSAATYLIDNPVLWRHIATTNETYVGPSADHHASVADIRQFMQENATLRTLARSFARFDADGDGFVTHADIERVARGEGHAQMERRAALQLLGNGALTQRISGYHATIEGSFDVRLPQELTMAGKDGSVVPAVVGFSRTSLLAMAVDRQAFVGWPVQAADFVLSIPIPASGESGVPLHTVSNEGLRPLAATALAALPGDLVGQQRVIAHLPESSEGVRNRLITGYYDLMARRSDALFDTVGMADVAGHHWLVYAPWASAAAGRGIRGETTVAGVTTPSARQALADGNQWIFDDVGRRFAHFLRLYEENHRPSSMQAESFFHGQFVEGDHHIMLGFAAYVAALNTPSSLDAQTLMFQANSLIATHEQAGAQAFLERVDDVPLLGDSWFHGWLTSATDLHLGERLLDVDVDDDFFGYDIDDNLVVGQARLDLDSGQVELGDLSAPGVRFEISPYSGTAIGVPAIGGVESKWGLDPRNSTWFEHGGGPNPDGTTGASASDWIDWDQRMWAIQTLFQQAHTEPDVLETNHHPIPLERIRWLRTE